MDKKQLSEKRENPVLFLLRVIQGTLIGGGAILPGVSGGVLCVIFGIYRPMMAFLSRPFKTFKENIRLFIPVIIGVAIGFVGFAKFVDFLFSEDSPYPLSLFVGLIFGTVPMLLKGAREKGDLKRGNISMGLSFALLLGFLILISSGQKLSLEPTLLWSFVSGIIWGFSLIIPGLSSSSILLFMGIYEKIMAGVGRLNFSVILPLFLGIALIAFLAARVVDRLFEKQYSIASHATVGLVLASTLMIIPRHYASLEQGLICLALAVVGFVLADRLAVFGEKVKAKAGV